MAKTSLVWVETPGLKGLDPAEVAKAAGVDLYDGGEMVAAIVTAAKSELSEVQLQAVEAAGVCWLDLAAEVGAGDAAHRAARAKVAVARAAGSLEAEFCQPEEPGLLPVSQEVLVAGSGAAALAVAAQAAELGHQVTLAVPGGDAAQAAPGEDPEELAAMAGALPAGVNVVAESDVISLYGAAGDFRARLSIGGAEKVHHYGAVALAPAGDMAALPYPAELDQSRVTLLSALNGDEAISGQVAVLAGTEAPAPAMSFERAVRAALNLRARGAQVFLFFYEARVGTREGEALYSDAREEGIIIARVKPGELEVAGGELVWTDAISYEKVAISPELIVVADEPAADAPQCLSNPHVWPSLEELAPYHARIEAGCTARPGLYLLGALSHTPWGEARMTEAAAAAGNLHAILSDPGSSAEVHESLCARCLTCVRVCKQGAPRFEDGRIKVAPAACIECGICATECPGQAIAPVGSATKEAIAGLRRAMALAPGGKTVLFGCQNSAMEALATLSAQGMELPAGFVVVPVSCAGRVGQRLILEALAQGAEKVLVAGCHVSNCFSQTGNDWAALQSKAVQKALRIMGADEARISFLNMASNQPERLAAQLREMFA